MYNSENWINFDCVRQEDTDFLFLLQLWVEISQSISSSIYIRIAFERQTERKHQEKLLFN